METSIIISLTAAAMSILSVIISWKSYNLASDYLIKKANKMDSFLDNLNIALAEFGETQ